MSLAILLDQVRQDRGLDLELYKQAFLERRLAIRMHARKCPDYAAYAQLLRKDPSEYEPLLDALRIHFTRFFRDESTFDCLRSNILPSLLKARAAQRKLRLWCAGCASGEEPYSLAMVVLTQLGAELPAWQLNVAATDINPQAIERARIGLFGPSNFRDLPPAFQQMVDTYTCAVGTQRQVQPALRERVNFKVHDLTRDPCLTNLDLLLCRNVLIYLDHSEQDRLYEAFYQAINPGGFLVLGKSEILPIHWAHRFVPADLREHIYQRAA